MSQTLKVGLVTAISVKKHTKKDWDDWISILNKRACQSYTHQELVQLLKKEFKLTTWWQQEVARGYQIAIGLRVPNQTLKGTYTTTATKSISTTAKKIFSFMVSDEGQQLWLKPLYKVKVKEKQNFECQGGIFGEFRTVESGKRLRFTWIDEEWPNKSTVQINIYLKPKDRCMIAIDHVDLPTLKAKTQMHERWRAAVDDLAEALQ